jgi:hypothetical protein
MVVVVHGKAPNLKTYVRTSISVGEAEVRLAAPPASRASLGRKSS